MPRRRIDSRTCPLIITGYSTGSQRPHRCCSLPVTLGISTTDKSGHPKDNSSPKVHLLREDPGPALYTWSFGPPAWRLSKDLRPPRIHVPNGILISSSVFAGLNLVTNRQTRYIRYIRLSSRVTRSVVCVFVCVVHTSESCRNGKTDRDSVSGVGLSVRGTHVDYTKCMLPVAWLDPPPTALRYVMYFRFYR